MAGRGFLEEAEKIDTKGIFVLRNGRWQKMFRPINPDRKFSGVSLGESFAEAYVKKHGVDVGLICCADGGTTLDQWMPDEILFDNAVYNSKLAARTSRIIGILWHQGESDCTEVGVATYKCRFEEMIKSLKKDIGIENVPVLVGGLGDYLKDYPLSLFEKLNSVLEKIAEEDEQIGFVSAKGLGSNSDKLHFSAKALYEFGLRYFEEYEKFDLLCDTSDLESDTKRTEMELL